MIPRYPPPAGNDVSAERKALVRADQDDRKNGEALSEKERRAMAVRATFDLPPAR